MMSSLINNMKWSHKQSLFIESEDKYKRYAVVSNGHSLFAIYNSTTSPIPKLFEYCHSNDSWIQYKTYYTQTTKEQIQKLCPMIHHAAMLNNKIYIFPTQWIFPLLFKLNKTNHDCLITLLKQNDLPTATITQRRTSCIVITERNEIHIMGGAIYGHKYHIIYNENEGIITRKHNLNLELDLTENIEGLHISSLVRVQSNKILLIGNRYKVCNSINARNPSRKRRRRIMTLYDMNENEWDKSSIIKQIPLTLAISPIDELCISIFNGSIVLIFSNNKKSIIIFDYLNQQFYKSKIECPIECVTDNSFPNNYKIFALNNDNNILKLITWGYIRNLFNTLLFSNQYFPPDYLIRIIYKYSIDIWIHLFTEKNINTNKIQHYKINAIDIINNKILFTSNELLQYIKT